MTIYEQQIARKAKPIRRDKGQVKNEKVTFISNRQQSLFLESAAIRQGFGGLRGLIRWGSGVRFPKAGK
jgi:hypothetical protein